MTVDAEVILDQLARLYPEAACALAHRNPFELLIATILSAQCTDQRVNQITRRLFAEASTPQAMVALGVDRVRELIHGCGLHNNKAANIVATCQQLLEKHQGEVPSSREDLEALPGVGRKTANVVLSNAYGVPAIAVDTHVFRVANRIGLSAASTPEKTEKQLMAVIPRDRWSHSHHLLIFHGRNLCKARNPQCEQCPLAEHCNYVQGRNQKERPRKKEGLGGQH
ncbi:MAG TPA: endonuclease III [Bacillota bacterium]|nr:endonuclease III [Bacillota bacterium]